MIVRWWYSRTSSRNIAKLLLNCGTSVVFGGVSQLANMGLFIVIARTVSLSEVGAFTLGMTLYQYVSLFSTSGWATWGERRLASGLAVPVEISAVMMLRFVTALILILGLVVYIIVAPAHDPNTTYIVLAFVLASLTGSISSDWMLRGMQRVGVSWAILAVLRVLILVVAVFVSRPGQVWIIPAAMAVLSLLMYFPIGRSVLGQLNSWPPILPSWVSLRRIFRASLPIAISAVGLGMFWSVDILILGILLGTEPVGQYSLGNRIPLAILTLFSFVVGAIYPTIVSIYKNSSLKVNLIIQGVYRAMLATIVPILAWMVIEAPSILSFLYGWDRPENHMEAIAVFRIFCGTVVLMCLSTIYGILVLLARNFDKRYMQVVVVTGILTIGLVFITTYLTGVVSVAWGVFCAQLISLAMYYFQSKGLLRLDLVWATVCIASSVAVLSCAHFLRATSAFSLLFALLLSVLLFGWVIWKSVAKMSEVNAQKVSCRQVG